MNILYLSIAGFASGILGSMGVGGGGILIVFLTLVFSLPQTQAQGINLLFFIPIALMSVIIYAWKKMIKPGVVIITASLGLVGAVIGTFLCGILGDTLLQKIFGGVLILISIKELFKGTKTNKNSSLN